MNETTKKIVGQREEGFKSAIIEEFKLRDTTWFVLTTRGKGGATIWPACHTLEGAQAKMAFWFAARG